MEIKEYLGIEYISELGEPLFIDEYIYMRATPIYKNGIGMWIRIYDRNGNFCRLNMSKAEFIGCDDETLKLSNDQIKKIINVLQSDNTISFIDIDKNGNEQTCEYIIRDTPKKEWNGIIAYCNWISGKEIPLDMPMPDYTKLLSD